MQGKASILIATVWCGPRAAAAACRPDDAMDQQRGQRFRGAQPYSASGVFGPFDAMGKGPAIKGPVRPLRLAAGAAQIIYRRQPRECETGEKAHRRWHSTRGRLCSREGRGRRRAVEIDQSKRRR